MKIFILSILLVLGALGCGTPHNPDPSHKESCVQKECPTGYACKEGSCDKINSETDNTTSCTPECSSDESCVNGACIKNEVPQRCGNVTCSANQVCDEDQETCRDKKGCELPGHECTPDSVCSKGECVKV